jgi:hypothetical protein
VPPAGGAPPVASACSDPATEAFPKILQTKCGALCHDPNKPALYAANMDLFSPGAKGRLLNAAAKTCPGETLITDKGPAGIGGFLFDKIAGTVSAQCGTRMPPVGAALTPEEVKCLKDWIRPTP